MDILLTGATGYIGSAVLHRLIESGHEVTAVVRSDASAGKVVAAGATAVTGDLADSGWFADRLREHDGAIHLAAPGDRTGAALDAAVVEAAITAYAGTDKPFVHTGGIWTYGENAAISDGSEHRPIAIGAWREEPEARLLGSGVRASVIRPAVVHGHGGGLVTLITDGPRTADGAVTLIGPGEQHWPMVHVDDLADFYLLVLVHAPGGEAYLAASGDNPTVREVALAHVGTGGTVAPESEEQTRERFGDAVGEALLLDQQASRSEAFGWAPQRPALLDEIRSSDRAS